MELTKEEQRENAAVILRQLGGRKFIAMTGAKHLGSDELGGLSFKIGRNAGNITHVKISINYGLDLYKIEFLKIRSCKIKVAKEYEGVYAESLAEILTSVTALNRIL